MHGVGIGDARERIGQVHALHFLEELANHALHQRGDRLLVDEGHFNIELGEFRLAVGAQVFVAEAAHDLIVAIEARHHQQLLEELRRLRLGTR